MVAPVVGELDSLRPDKSPVSEILNVGYAYHEFSDHKMEDVMQWLDEKCSMLTLESVVR